MTYINVDGRIIQSPVRTTPRRLLQVAHTFTRDEGPCDDDAVYEYTPKPEYFERWQVFKARRGNEPDDPIGLDDEIRLRSGSTYYDCDLIYSVPPPNQKRSDKWFTESYAGTVGH